MPENRIKITFEAHTEANTKAESMKNKIIEYIKTKSITELTRKELAEALGDESAVKRALKMLERDGYIQGGGNTKNRIYTVIPPEK
jgi:predicted ArsR family transcriptional regulator